MNSSTFQLNNIPMSIVTVKNKYQVVIPQLLRDQIRVKVGDIFEAKAEKGRIIFTPQTVMDRGIAESMADFKAGRSHGPFKDHKAFTSALHRQASKLKGKN